MPSSSSLLSPQSPDRTMSQKPRSGLSALTKHVSPHSHHYTAPGQPGLQGPPVLSPAPSPCISSFVVTVQHTKWENKCTSAHPQVLSWPALCVSERHKPVPLTDVAQARSLGVSWIPALSIIIPYVTGSPSHTTPLHLSDMPLLPHLHTTGLGPHL